MNYTRAAVFHEPGQPLTLEQVLLPEPGPGEILVRNAYSTLCRSDLKTYAGKRIEKTPTILGHEIVGRIEAIGPDTPLRDARGAALRVGDLVTWAIYASDPGSSLAQRGIPQKGEGLFKYGHERVSPECHLHGGLADHCLLRRHTPVLRVSEDIPLPVLALINCSVATVAGALRLAGPLQHQTVLIAGAGMLGLVAAAMARTADARTIVAADIDPHRLETALRFGADRTVQLLPGHSLEEALAAVLPDEPINVAVDLSGVPETMEALVRNLGIGGTLVLVGATYPQRPLALDAEHLVRKLLTLRGLHNYNQQDFLTAVEFIEHHHDHFPFADLVEDRFDLDHVEQAFAHALNSGAFRVGLRLGDRL